MKIFVFIPPKFAGCGFYRLYQPHNHMAKNYDVKIIFGSHLMKNEFSAYTDDEIKEFDLFVWHKTYFELSDIKRIKSLGVPTVVDFDDHWVVPRNHSLYKQYTDQGLTTRLHKALLTADYITCTTEILADEIYTQNENVEVLSNAVDTAYSTWKNDRVKEDKYVFGYLGGPCHVRDVSLLRGLQDELSGNFILRLFGYNGTDIYKHYASVLMGEKRQFEAHRGADIWNYPKFYNMMDCSLVPLEDSRFNSMKSELKLIEAGAFSKAVIVSNVQPYTNIINSKNCLTVNTKSDWAKHCKTLIDNPQLGVDLGLQLKEDTRSYDISVVNQKRYKFYENVCKKQNTISSRELSRMVNV